MFLRHFSKLSLLIDLAHLIHTLHIRVHQNRVNNVRVHHELTFDFEKAVGFCHIFCLPLMNRV